MKSIQTVLVIACALGFAACGVKVTPSGGAPAKVVDKGIAGPDISGDWASGCEADWRSNGWMTLEISYKEKTVSRRTRTFDDRQCTRLVSEKTEDGTFLFKEAYKDGGFALDYRIDLGNGITALPKEKVLLEGDTLYVGDYQVGEAVTKDMMIPLKKH